MGISAALLAYRASRWEVGCGMTDHYEGNWGRLPLICLQCGL